jgi:hypothetical protein
MPQPTQSASLRELKRLFSELAPPSPAMRRGFFRARFIGPWWLRATGQPAVEIAGLPGWEGKRFLSEDDATNVVVRRGERGEALAMRVTPGISQVDGVRGVALHYVPAGGVPAPLPWRWVRDELRALDDDSILGMTVVDLPLLRRVAFPFLLERAEADAP